MIRSVLHPAFALGAALALASAPATAGTDTDTLSVTATVLSSCSLNGGTMNFGQYLSGQNGNLDVNGTINYVNCDAGELTFALDGGFSGDINNRVMRSGQNELRYQLYRTPTRDAIFGSGANAQKVQVVSGPLSSSVTVYGRIPGNQLVPAGIYTDTVNVTLTF
jgi:spore coat protein U-like protein